MCYSISLKKTKREIEKFYDFSVEPKLEFPLFVYASAFDFPTWPIIHFDSGLHMKIAGWGLIPRWAKTDKEAERLRKSCFNARGETIFRLPSFKKSAESSRCIVPVSGFFEYMSFAGKKYPHFIYPNDESLFSLGGLFDTYINIERNEILLTFSIVTTVANDLMAKIHNTKKRMPLILDRKKTEVWLNPNSSVREISSIMDPYPSCRMSAHALRKNFYQPTKDGGNNIAPFDYPELHFLDGLDNA
jgi:putative SOS response-associated peptidase YedK